MAFPGRFEIQLGHLCNNRCVFCVSGQLTHTAEAPLLDPAVLKASIREARASGATSLTFLGGEPTIQPFFLDLVREAVALAFDEIVIFSNGSKPARTDLVDQVAATGGRFEWRFSFQGATLEAHERTTLRRGSFEQLLRSVARARSHGHRVTVNTCVVRQNFESLPALGPLVVPLGVAQVHVDLLNPYDTGTLPEPEVRALQPRLSELAEPLARMIAGFPEGFDVNIGNLPFCIAPELTPWIHHGGRPTQTVTADDLGDRALARPKDKYLVKSERRSKPDTCRACALDERCRGVFDLYREWHGTDELVPLTTERLASIDPEQRLLALHLGPRVKRALRPGALPAPFTHVRIDDDDVRTLKIELTSGIDPGARLRARFGLGEGGVARTSRFHLAIEHGAGSVEPAVRALWDAATDGVEASVVVPLGPDALAALPPRLRGMLGRLRASAPFGDARWARTTVTEGGHRVEIVLVGPARDEAALWMTDTAGRVAGGYRIVGDIAPTPALEGALAAAHQALGAVRPAARDVPSRAEDVG